MGANMRYTIRRSMLRASLAAPSRRHRRHTMSNTAIGPFVDADGHVVEPPDMLTRYIDRKFRDMIPRHSLDPEGYDVLEPVKTGIAFGSGFFPDFTSRPNCAPNNAGRP